MKTLIIILAILFLSGCGEICGWKEFRPNNPHKQMEKKDMGQLVFKAK